MPDSPHARPLRLGVFDASDLARSILAGTGRDESEVRWIRYDVRDPFLGLRTDAMDLVMARYEVHEPGVRSSGPVAWDGRAAVFGAQHPLAGRARVTLDELAGFDAFQCPEGFPASVWDRIVPPCAPSGRPISRVHRPSSVPAMVDLLRTTNAVHLSFASVASILPPDVRGAPIDDLPPAPVVLVWSGERPLPETAAAFVADAEAAVRARAH